MNPQPCRCRGGVRPVAMRTTASRILQARYLCHTPCHNQISWSGAQNAPQGPQRCVNLCMHLHTHTHTESVCDKERERERERERGNPWPIPLPRTLLPLSVSLPSPCNVCHILFRHSIFERGAGTVLPKKLRTQAICVQRKRASAAPHSRGLPGLSVYMSVSLTSCLCLCICVLFAFLTRWTIIHYCVSDSWGAQATKGKSENKTWLHSYHVVIWCIEVLGVLELNKNKTDTVVVDTTKTKEEQSKPEIKCKFLQPPGYSHDWTWLVPVI